MVCFLLVLRGPVYPFLDTYLLDDVPIAAGTNMKYDQCSRSFVLVLHVPVYPFQSTYLLDDIHIAAETNMKYELLNVYIRF